MVGRDKHDPSELTDLREEDTTRLREGGTGQSESGSKVVSSDSEPVSDPLVGQVLEAKIRIDALVGEGGMGKVYRGHHLLLDKVVAVKLLKSATDENTLKRFMQEGRVAFGLANENICAVHDVQLSQGKIPYIVMDWLDGKDLKSWIKTEQGVSVERVVDVLLQCCSGLSAAHQSGIIHRDIKPSNIVITSNSNGQDLVKIVDFGMARIVDDAEASQLTGTGSLIGTPAYMSPEQVGGYPSDARTDIYALGCVMFEMLTGRPVFTGAVLPLLMQHANERPETLSAAAQRPFPDAVESVVSRMLEKDPRDRYQTVDELKEDLLCLKQQVPVKHAKPLRKRRRQLSRFVLGAIATMAVVIAMILATPHLLNSWWQNSYNLTLNELSKGNAAHSEPARQAVQLAEFFGSHDPRLISSLRNLQQILRLRQDWPAVGALEAKIVQAAGTTDAWAKFACSGWDNEQKKNYGQAEEQWNLACDEAARLGSPRLLFESLGALENLHEREGKIAGTGLEGRQNQALLQLQKQVLDCDPEETLLTAQETRLGTTLAYPDSWKQITNGSWSIDDEPDPAILFKSISVVNEDTYIRLKRRIAKSAEEALRSDLHDFGGWGPYRKIEINPASLFDTRHSTQAIDWSYQISEQYNDVHTVRKLFFKRGSAVYELKLQLATKNPPTVAELQRWRRLQDRILDQISFE